MKKHGMMTRKNKEKKAVIDGAEDVKHDGRETETEGENWERE